jgi:hypothetical protein
VLRHFAEIEKRHSRRIEALDVCAPSLTQSEYFTPMAWFGDSGTGNRPEGARYGDRQKLDYAESHISPAVRKWGTACNLT